MRLWLLLWLALASLTNTRGKKPFVPLPYPKINNRTFIKECLDAHNKHRSEVNPPASDMLYMTWDLALARTARAWANKCIFEHNPYRGHPHPKLRPTGENLLAGGAIRRPYNSASAIRVFYNEVKYYNYNKHSCTHVCGHYTQCGVLLTSLAVLLFSVLNLVIKKILNILYAIMLQLATFHGDLMKQEGHVANAKKETHVKITSVEILSVIVRLSSAIHDGIHPLNTGLFVMNPVLLLQF
ncbi:glioma pathogenesis-related protein 1-like isoform X2 [Hemicordylus capensis]|uniref:glioma pathogenesis-related protein 1-like isoform X2 n=1 Tax=Hemicordylus capensis TaxID=884348 RepID=UPI002302BF3A|nr:glioma pathogenesis-related protein 1-like isoform X2 [Hemicordylus capensis]